MKKPKVIYRDVTGDPEAAAQANRAPELRADLLANGFTPVGLAEFRSPAMAAELTPFSTNPDFEMIRDVAENGEVDEVMTSPDQRAFAAVENAFGGSVVSIRTLMENGRVVETTMKPTRPPQTPSLFGDLNSQNAQANFPMSITLKLMQFGMGQLPLWPRGDSPRAGYHVELVDTRDAGELWRRHQQRLEAIQQSNPARIRPHIVLPLYMSFNCRTMEIMEHQAKWGGRISNMLFALFLLAIPLTLLITFQTSATFKTFIKASPFGVLFVLAPILFMAAVAISVMILMGLSKTYLVPRLPGPKLRPASELLAEAQTRLTTTPRPKLQASSHRAQIPARMNFGQPRPASEWLSRNRTLLDGIVAGMFMGIVLSSRHFWTLATIGLLDIVRQLGLGLAFGALATILMTSGTSIKGKVIIGSMGGLITALILPFIPVEGSARILVSASIGALTWATVGLLVRRLMRAA